MEKKEKIETLSILLEKLKGQKVFIIFKHSPEADLECKDVIIAGTDGEWYEYWVAAGGKTFDAFGREEYSEPCLINSTNYIGNIAAIARENVDLYRRDMSENIFFEDKEMVNESKGKTR